MRFQRVSYLTFWLSLPIAFFAAQGVHAQSVHVESTAYPSVTDERLQHPEAGDWLMYRRTYDGWGFSPLKEITLSNIHKLSLAWSMSTDLLGAHETTAIVNHGRMFITTPQNNIIALDAKTGTQRWRYARKYPDGLFQLHPTNRGVALYGDYVYMATTDCALVALDAATGKEVWNVPLDDYKTGCYSTLAPLTVRGKIITGYSGGELGVRGSVSAFDALTGKRIWKTYTVPAPNEPGADTWKGETYKRGGGSTWITGVYDPASNTTYWGTGNPGPWVADDRPGDNLYTDSTLALDADTGKIKSYHQYTPHDSFDWDEVSAPLLIDTEVDGKLTKTATHAGRNGYLWILDRDDLKFLHAFPFANNNVFASIDPKTGRPTVDESKRPGAHQGAEFCPSIGGGKDWPPEAWSPQTKLLYIPANDNVCAYLPKGEVPEADSKGFYVGYDVDSIFGSVRTGAGASDHLGELQAWDLNTGKRVWQHNFKTILWSPLLVTGGDILFAGGTPDRLFRAFNARTGDQLWSFPLPSGAIGVPTSFAVDGEQYVAVTTGWDLDARGLQNGIDEIQGTKTVVPKAGTLLVFKLREL
ncbi:MAG TPA: PQQ-dependent dehydrogenase, methanol/ethanol family [Candidatus Polarisedimenticolia bacterium]|nr:PQQ-dependent dehydrogenase, methanol/ethanol family [Candidatus Polarisedimenticolia bacterium]